MNEPTLDRTGGPGAPPASAAQEQLLEQLRLATVGEYDIFGELGRGGMATVFLAHDLALDRKVAIKVMSPGLVHGPGMVERFKREARTAGNLSHPNIIPVFAVREVQGLLFFVMKLVQGTPLDAVMRELGQLPLPMVEAILAQVGGAFGYAHRHGVVHRDIKPGNILIDDEGWAVVTDFGIAKVQESEGLTQSGVAVGTPAYMSPEQCSGGEITGASDQYSLGVVAYEMLAGRPPFTGSTMMALMFSHFHDAPPPLEQFRPDCPAPLRDAVMRMLRKDVAERWPSMEDAVASMGARPLAHDDPTRSQLISIAKTGMIHRIVSQVQTPRSPVPLSGRSATPPPVPAPATPAPVPAPPRFRTLTALVGVVALLAIAILAVLLLKGTSPGSPPDAAAPAVNIGSGGTGPGSAADSAAGSRQAVSLPPAPAGKVSTTLPGRDGGGSRAASTPRTGQPAKPAPQVAARDEPPVIPETTRSAAAAPAPAPVPPPAPAQSSAAVLPVPQPLSTAIPEAAAPVESARAAIETTILSYARSLEAGDLAEARRLFPAMPSEQRQGLEALWQSGGTMRPRWTVSDVAVDGDQATARVQGATSVTAPKSRPADQRVNLRAKLERRGRDWRLVALTP